MLDIALFSATPLSFGGGFETFLVSFREFALASGYSCEICTPPTKQFLRLVGSLRLGRRFSHLTEIDGAANTAEILRSAKAVYAKNEILDLCWLRTFGSFANLTIGFHTRLVTGQKMRDALYQSPFYDLLVAKGRLHFIRNEPFLSERYSNRPQIVAPNGVAFDELRDRDAPINRPIEFLYVGRLSYEKGPERLVAPLEALERPWRLTIVGDGPLADVAASWMARDSRVMYLGRLAYTAVRSQYERADFILLPSRWENVPFTLLEGAASGAVPLASDLPEIRGILRQWPSTTLDFSDVKQLSQAVEVLLSNEGREYHALRKALHGGLGERFSTKRAYQPLLDFILSQSSQ